MDNNSTINYKEILGEIGAQIQLRKSQLAKRILLIVWPYLLFIIIGFIGGSIYDDVSLTDQEKLKFVVVFFALVIASVIYSTIIRFIFNIEKQIWIDSYFDKRNLKPEESWKIAYKLIWPALKFRLKLWFNYYFIPITSAIAICAFAIWIYVKSSDMSKGYESLVIGYFVLFIVFIVGTAIYSYYMRTKLRYTWFIFLDRFGTEKTYRSMIEDMNQLNDISKSETFRKSLIVNIGADSVDGITKIAVGTISYGLSQLGDSGKLLGGILRVYGEEASRQTTDLANISAQYVLYRFARKQAHGNEQEINENVYRLLNS